MGHICSASILKRERWHNSEETQSEAMPEYVNIGFVLQTQHSEHETTYELRTEQAKVNRVFLLDKCQV